MPVWQGEYRAKLLFAEHTLTALDDSGRRGWPWSPSGSWAAEAAAWVEPWLQLAESSEVGYPQAHAQCTTHAVRLPSVHC